MSNFHGEYVMRTLLVLMVIVLLTGCAAKYICGECDDNGVRPCWLTGDCRSV